MVQVVNMVEGTTSWRDNYHKEKLHTIKVWKHNQDYCDGQEKHKSQSTMSFPACLLNFYFTEGIQKYLQKQVQYCRTTVCETISCESSTDTLGGLQSVPKLSATGF